METISEEHNSYLAQNLMANAALRSSLLGHYVDLAPAPAPLREDLTIPPQSPTIVDDVTIPFQVSDLYVWLHSF